MLSFNGITDYLHLPSITIDAIEITCRIDSLQNSTPTLFDARVGGSAYLSASTSSGISKLYVDGVEKTNKLFTDIPKNKDVVVRVEFPATITDDIHIFSDNTGASNLKGKLTKVVCYLSSSAVSQYKLEEGYGDRVYDTIGTNHAMIKGKWILDKIIDGIKFDGDSSYVDCGDFPAYTTFTVEALIRMSPNGDDWQRIMQRGHGDGEGWSLRNYGDKISFQVKRHIYDFNLLTANLVYDQWYHIVGTYDQASDTMKLYMNLVEQTSTVNDDAGDGGGTKLQFGRRSNADAYYWRGGLGYIRIYNRVLTIAELKNSILGMKTVNGLQHEWMFSDLIDDDVVIKDRIATNDGTTYNVLSTRKPVPIRPLKNYIRPITSPHWTLLVTNTINADYDVSFQATGPMRLAELKMVPVLPNTDYVISCIISPIDVNYRVNYELFDINGNLTDNEWGLSGDDSNRETSFRTNSDSAYMKVYFWAEVAGTCSFRNFQIEEGTAATVFEPYDGARRSKELALVPKKNILKPLAQNDNNYPTRYQINGAYDATLLVDFARLWVYVKPYTDYVVSVTGITGPLQYAVYNHDGGDNLADYTNLRSLYFNSGVENNYVRVYLTGVGGSFTGMMVEEGKYPTTFEPYIEVRDARPTPKKPKKNLVRPLWGNMSADRGMFTFSGDYSGTVSQAYANLLFEVKPYTDYTVSFQTKDAAVRWAVYDPGGDHSVSSYTTNNSKTFNSGGNSLVRMYFETLGAFGNLMIEEGTVATAFEAFSEVNDIKGL